MTSNEITVGSTVRVRGLTAGRPPHGIVVRGYVNGDFKVTLTGASYAGQSLRVTAERLTVI